MVMGDPSYDLGQRTPLPPNQGWENGAFLAFARLHPWFGGVGGGWGWGFAGKPRPPPPPPPNQEWENGAFLPFARLHPWFGGNGGLLFHFILSKIVGDVTRFGGVIRLSIKSLILIWSRLHDRWGNPPHITSLTWGPPPPCKQALREKYQEKNLKT